MHILSMAFLSLNLVSFCAFGMDSQAQEPKELPEEEVRWGDVRWFFTYCIPNEIKRFKNAPRQNLATLKGWFKSYMNVMDCGAIPVFFVTLYALKFVALDSLLYLGVHAFAEVPESEAVLLLEKLISGGVIAAESAYITWANKDLKIEKIE